MYIVDYFDNPLKAAKSFSISAGFVVLFIGFISIVGWLTDIAQIVRLSPSFSAIQFNTALCFLFLGLALIFFFGEHSYYFYVNRAIGIFVFFIGAISLIEYLTNELIISQIFFKNDLNEIVNTTGRPALITVIGFVFSGLAFIIYPTILNNNFTNLAYIITGCAILCIGLFGFLSFFVPLETRFGYFYSYIIAPQSAFAFILVGCGIISASFYASRIHSFPLFDKLPYLMTFFGLMLTSLLCVGLRNYQIRVGQEISLSVAEAIEKQLMTHYRQIVKNTEHIYQKELKNDLTFSKEWHQRMMDYLAEHSDEKAIGWADSELNIIHLVPIEEKQKLQGYHLMNLFVTEELKTRLADNKSVFLFSDTSVADDSFLLLIPHVEKGVLKGVLFNILNPESFIKLAILDVIIEQFNVKIWHQNTQFIDSEVGQPIHSAQITISFKIGDIDLNLTLIPTMKNYSILMSNALVVLFLVIGIFNSIILGALAYYWQSNYQQLNEITNVKERLNLALSSAHLGTWTWDPEKDFLYWDAYTSSLLGLSSKEYTGKIDDLLSYFLGSNINDEKKKIYSALKQQSIYQSEGKILLPDFSIHSLSFRGSMSPVGHKMSGVCWDVTTFRESQDLLQTEYAISKILKNSESLASAGPKILEVLCTKLNWDLGAFWIKSEQISNKLECLATWHQSNISFPNFITISKQLYLAKGAGFPGKIWAEGMPSWVEDIAKNPTVLFSSEAILDGLHGAMAFPIMDEKGIIGVIELYRISPLAGVLKADLLNFISTSLNNAICQFYWSIKDEKIRSELAAIVEFSRDAIYSRDLDGKILNWNQGAVDLFEYEPNEIIGSTAEKLIPKDRIKEFNWLLDEAKKGKVIKDFETKRIQKSGKEIWVYMTVSPIRDKAGNVIQTCVISQNIENLKKTEASLRENQEKFKAFVETTSEWVWALDAQRNISYTNPTVQNLLGYSTDEITGQDALTLIYEEDRDFFAQSFNEAIKRKRGWLSQTLRWKHKNGSLMWMEGNSEAIIELNNQISGFRGSSRDVTERKNLEKLKDEFVSMVNHELRTPLTSIRGALGLVLGRFASDLTAKVQQLLQIALNNSERLIKIINDILDIEKMQAGKISMQISEVNLSAIIKDSIRSISTFADKFQVTIKADQLPEMIPIKGDSSRLMQVMDNLLSNAIKFSPAGSVVTISAFMNGTKVKIAISDQGEGIPEKIQPLIFQKFVQADTSNSRKVAGTGLGLVITKNIIERLGGTIYFESKLNQGTTFYFELPLIGEKKAQSEKPQSSSPSIHYSFLLLEKDPHLSRMLEHQLQKEGFTVYSADNCQASQKLANSKPINAIILDLDSMEEEEIANLHHYCNTLIQSIPIVLTSQKTSSEKQQLIDKSVPILRWIEKPNDNETISAFINHIKKLLFVKSKVLWLVEDPELIEHVKTLLGNSFTLTPVSSLVEAHIKITERNYDLLVVDPSLISENDRSLLPFHAADGKPLPIIMLIEKNFEEWQPNDFVKGIIKKSNSSSEEIVDVIRNLLKKPVSVSV